ncbi:RIMS-binding protein 3B-like isoform 1-T11 [Ciconia maguari]
MCNVGGCWWQCLIAIPAAMNQDSVGQGPVACSRPLPRRGLAQKDEHKRQLERLQAELEAEQLRSQELCRHFAAEIRELKEAAERDRQLLAEWLHSKWEQWQARELQQLQDLNQWQRAVENRQLLRSKEAELREVQGMLQQQHDDAIHQARDLQQQLAKKLVRGAWSSSEAHSKLQDVLSKLHWETNGKQATCMLCLQDKLLLQRRCFLKCILERFDGKQLTTCNEARAKATAWHHLQTLLGTGAIRPCSLERLTASSSHDGEGLRKTCKSLKDAHFQEEGNSMEVLLKAVGQDLVLHCLDSLPQGQTGSGWFVAEVGVQTVGQQEDWLPRSSHSRLLEQNAHLQSARKDLERQCSVLQEENCLLRKATSPEVWEAWERFKQKTVKLGLISKQLQERARQLQTI